MSSTVVTEAPIEDAPYPLYPEQLPPAPRRVALTADLRWQRRGALLALFLGSVLFVTGGRVVEAMPDPLATHGEGIFGTVTSKRTATGLSGEPTYHVGYAFHIGKRRYESEAAVSREEFEQYHPL